MGKRSPKSCASYFAQINWLLYGEVPERTTELKIHLEGECISKEDELKIQMIKLKSSLANRSTVLLNLSGLSRATEPVNYKLIQKVLAAWREEYKKEE